jgi:ADP-heptose:LPS heptosyltransferase
MTAVPVRGVAMRDRFLAAAARLFDRQRADVLAPRQWRRVLVMQMQQFGDSILFTPTLRALRAAMPDAHITMLVSSVSKQLYEKCPHIDEIVVATGWRAGAGGSRLRPLLPVLRALRRRRFDAVITDITQQSFKYALVAYLSGARERIGFNIDHRGFLYTRQVPLRTDVNWLDCNLDIARMLGAVAVSSREEICTDASDDEHARALIEEHALASGPLVLVHVGSNWQSKLWFAPRWADLVGRLVRDFGVRVAFVGTPKEEATYAEVARELTVEAASLLGRTTVPQLAALARHAALFIGTDSGPRHLAGAVGTPSVTVMSAQNDTDRWHGFREYETVIRSEPPCFGCALASCAHQTCMYEIPVSTVYQACAAYLSGASSASASLIRIPVDTLRTIA